MSKLPRRKFLHLVAGAAALPTTWHITWAQTYPSRPVTLIVFVGPGGAPDIKARILAQALSQRLGQPVVVDNRPGVGGHLALQAVARAPADGYTLLLVATPHAVNATLHEQITVVRDIAPVAGISGDPFVMVVNPSFPAKTLPEFVAYAKANPGKINMTSSGSGNLSHLSGEMFRMMTGIEMVHVPYKGTVAALTGVVAGEVHIMFDATTSALPHVQSGRLRALAVTSARRVEALPGVPTVAEVAPGYEVSGVLGIGAPKDTPANIIGKLNTEINAILADPGSRAKLADFGSTVLAGTSADFGKYVREEVDKWSKVVRFAGIKSQ
jgi:tripartite-type tricarboxylate transporter receptor subunit TctC